MFIEMSKSPGDLPAELYHSPRSQQPHAVLGNLVINNTWGCAGKQQPMFDHAAASLGLFSYGFVGRAPLLGSCCL